MPGWRIGWLVGVLPVVDAVLRVKSNMDSGMFLERLAGSGRALQQPDGWFEGLNHLYRQRRAKRFELLELLSCVFRANRRGCLFGPRCRTAFLRWKRG